MNVKRQTLKTGQDLRHKDLEYKVVKYKECGHAKKKKKR